MHAPHCPSPHPYFVPVRSSRLRNTERSVSSGGASTRRAFPLTVRTSAAIPAILMDAAPFVPEPDVRAVSDMPVVAAFGVVEEAVAKTLVAHVRGVFVAQDARILARDYH